MHKQYSDNSLSWTNRRKHISFFLRIMYWDLSIAKWEPYIWVEPIVMSALFIKTNNFKNIEQFNDLAIPSVYNKLLKSTVIYWFVKGNVKENVKENVKKHSQCSFETMKILKLERHVQRIHGVVLVKDVLPLCGYCLCLESGQKYHNKNRDLQSHLIRSQITNYISKLKSLIYFKVNNWYNILVLNHLNVRVFSISLKDL